MKTPRELLFEKHQHAMPRLDAVRREVIGKIQAETEPRANIFTKIGLKIWQELIFPSRRIWIGLAGAWMLVIGLNLAASGDSSVPKMAATKPITREAALIIRAREQEIAKFIEQFTAEPAEPPPVVPAPRSERRPIVMVG